MPVKRASCRAAARPAAHWSMRTWLCKLANGVCLDRLFPQTAHVETVAILERST